MPSTPGSVAGSAGGPALVQRLGRDAEAYQTLGIDENGDGSFLTDHYGEDAFSVIIIDECHRSAWGKWSQVLTRNPNAIHIGLTATPRKLKAAKHEKKSADVEAAIAEDEAITAHNVKYFGEPVYEYTLAQAQEDGYLAACEIEKRKADIDARVFTREEILKAGVRDIRTGKPLGEEDLTKAEYTGKDFDDELFIDLALGRLDLVISDVPLQPGASFKAFNHPLGHSEVAIFAAPDMADRLRRRFPRSLDGAPFLLPSGTSALRRELDAWFDQHELRPAVVGEFDDSALLKVYGQAGVGAFAGPSVIAKEIARQYRVKLVGRAQGPVERFFAISAERRLKHPGIVAISAAARSELFAAASPRA